MAASWWPSLWFYRSATAAPSIAPIVLPAASVPRKAAVRQWVDIDELKTAVRASSQRRRQVRLKSEMLLELQTFRVFTETMQNMLNDFPPIS